MKWDGEWQITYEVFRDLGIAFAVVLVLIAILVIGWFQSFAVPLAILLPIPLSLIGILPGHWAFGAFFTATSMIGFIAGAGIIVRNSIILVDFIELRLRQGMRLEEAVVEAGELRFRPILLTAAAVVVGSLVMLFDPIFQGLAISLMMGSIAAVVLSPLTVPVLYYLIARRGRAEELQRESLVPSRRAHRRSLDRLRGGPRVEGESTMTIERALRILAGLFVMLSVALGYWVHPAWFLLTGFVGLNLFQSGFTNTCPAMAIFRKLGLRDCVPAERAARGGDAAMKAIMLITDSEAMRAFERVLVAEGTTASPWCPRSPAAAATASRPATASTPAARACC